MIQNGKIKGKTENSSIIVKDLNSLLSKLDSGVAEGWTQLSDFTFTFLDDTKSKAAKEKNKSGDTEIKNCHVSKVVSQVAQ